MATSYTIITAPTATWTRVRTGRVNMYEGPCPWCKQRVPAKAGELIDLQYGGKHDSWRSAHPEGGCPAIEPPPLPAVAGIDSCTQYRRDQGCPLHGELCAEMRSRRI